MINKFTLMRGFKILRLTILTLLAEFLALKGIRITIPLETLFNTAPENIH